jgi:hypothetical protein
VGDSGLASGAPAAGPGAAGGAGAAGPAGDAGEDCGVTDTPGTGW